MPAIVVTVVIKTDNATSPRAISFCIIGIVGENVSKCPRLEYPHMYIKH